MSIHDFADLLRTRFESEINNGLIELKKRTDTVQVTIDGSKYPPQDAERKLPEKTRKTREVLGEAQGTERIKSGWKEEQNGDMVITFEIRYV